MTDLPRLFRLDPEREDWEQYWNPEMNIFDGWLVAVDEKLLTAAEWRDNLNRKAMRDELMDSFLLSERLATHLVERLLMAGSGSRNELDEWQARRNAAALGEQP